MEVRKLSSAPRDDLESSPATFARDLTSLLQVPGASGIRGLAIGRFQRASRLTRPLLEQIVDAQPALGAIPVVAGVDVGHTYPLATFPVGGQARLPVTDAQASLTLLRH
ncbi:hypothetical protein ACIBG4_37035 [Nonomuraea sp. NPDC050383]|uniref:hypothetical protein n=1 Tax=Nonomuraea sp. NPDC050383 TaxID=3364362 RepID=UPI003793E3BF